jgi:hypothetical protein
VVPQKLGDTVEVKTEEEELLENLIDHRHENHNDINIKQTHKLQINGITWCMKYKWMGGGDLLEPTSNSISAGAVEVKSERRGNILGDKRNQKINFKNKHPTYLSFFLKQIANRIISN